MYNKIHLYLLEKSDKIKSLNKFITINGVQKIDNNNLDLSHYLAKIIISQQINFQAASKIWLKLKNYCRINNLSFISFINDQGRKKDFTELGISEKKKETIKVIIEDIVKKKITPHKLEKMRPNEFYEFLQNYKGIGPWTCNMLLIFFFKKKNIWPKNDLVINKVSNLIEEIEMKHIDFEKLFKPYLSILALHFWKIFLIKKNQNKLSI